MTAARATGVAVVVLLLAFLTVTSLVVIVVSFNPTAIMAVPPHGLSLRWYENALTYPQFQRAVVNSLIVTAAATLLALPIGTAAALALVRHRVAARAVWAAALLSPVVVPGVAAGLGFLILAAGLGLLASRGVLIAVHALHRGDIRRRLRRRALARAWRGVRPGGPRPGRAEPVSAGKSVVALEGVRKAYGETVAMDGVDLAIDEGELLTLLGPSGCGKTTTLNVIAGFVVPDAGHVRIDGAEVTARPAWQRGLGVVFQSYALFPHMSVADNVAFGLRERGVGRTEAGDRVREALALVRLQCVADRRPAQLSGGQQQRVG